MTKKKRIASGVSLVLLTGLVLVLASFGGSPVVKLWHQDMDQFELQSPDGVPVFIDVFDPSRLVQPVSTRAILLESYLVSLAGTDMATLVHGRGNPVAPGLIRQEGLVELEDVKLTTIGSTELDFPADMATISTNFIGRIETGGLRIVYLGNFGQTVLTQAQRDFIGEPDVLIANLAIRQQSLTNPLRLKLIEQLKPRLVVIGLITPRMTAELITRHKVWYAADHLEISKATLPTETTYVMVGREKAVYASLAGAEPWESR